MSDQPDWLAVLVATLEATGHHNPEDLPGEGLVFEAHSLVDDYKVLELKLELRRAEVVRLRAQLERVARDRAILRTRAGQRGIG